uniref:Uncharacterized protein n=1 Tax=Hucho hucho TaxID=62062 RepID=A0A4W5K404_9TELE
MEKGYPGDGTSAPYPGPPMNYGGVATGQGPQPPGRYPPSPGPPQPGFQPGPYQGGECLLVHTVLQNAGFTAYSVCENQVFSQMVFATKYTSSLECLFLYLFCCIINYILETTGHTTNAIKRHIWQATFDKRLLSR